MPRGRMDVLDERLVVMGSSLSVGQPGLAHSVRSTYPPVRGHFSASDRADLATDGALTRCGTRSNATISVTALRWGVFHDVSVEVGIVEPGCRCLVDDNRHVRMQLKHRSRATCGNRSLDGSRNGSRLMTARRDEHRVSGGADGAESLGDDMTRHFVDAVEEPGIVLPGLLCQRRHPGTRSQRRTRLVEPDV